MHDVGAPLSDARAPAMSIELCANSRLRDDVVWPSLGERQHPALRDIDAVCEDEQRPVQHATLAEAVGEEIVEDYTTYDTCPWPGLDDEFHDPTAATLAAAFGG